MALLMLAQPRRNGPPHRPAESSPHRGWSALTQWGPCTPDLRVPSSLLPSLPWHLHWNQAASCSWNPRTAVPGSRQVRPTLLPTWTKPSLNLKSTLKPSPVNLPWILTPVPGCVCVCVHVGEGERLSHHQATVCDTSWVSYDFAVLTPPGEGIRAHGRARLSTFSQMPTAVSDDHLCFWPEVSMTTPHPTPRLPWVRLLCWSGLQNSEQHFAHQITGLLERI